MKVRYTGDDEARDLALSGGFIVFPRMQWVDIEEAAEEAGIAAHHLKLAVKGLGPDWETEKPAARKAAAKKES